MSVYYENPTGGVKAWSCVTPFVVKLVVAKYGVGDTLYDVAKAERGVVEVVVVKAVQVTRSSRRKPFSEVMYCDTFNGIWNEWELVSYTEMLELIEAYDARVRADFDEINVC